MSINFEGSKNTLKSNGLVVLYGPFKHNNEYSSVGDEQLDLMLKQKINHLAYGIWKSLKIWLVCTILNSLSRLICPRTISWSAGKKRLAIKCSMAFIGRKLRRIICLV